MSKCVLCSGVCSKQPITVCCSVAGCGHNNPLCLDQETFCSFECYTYFREWLASTAVTTLPLTRPLWQLPLFLRQTLDSSH